ncbi:MAG: hypothetical protein GX621_18740 [Pirellulaceae bacterium]|nr:hypothetical protein [Pirellulaceae bacterium]
MIEKDRTQLRSVAWSEIFPWLSLFRTFRIAIRFRVLVFGAAAALITLTGWSLVNRAFTTHDSSMVSYNDEDLSEWDDDENEPNSRSRCPWTSMTSLVENKYQPERALLRGRNPFEMESKGPLASVWQELGGQFQNVFSRDATLVSLARSLVCGLWAVLVWGFFGGAITRAAALELAADERVGTRELLGFVRQRWLSYVAAPLFPLLGVLLVTAGIFLVALPLLAGVTAWISALFWPLLLLGGLVMAVLLLGLWFGWPLMYPTISAEGTDSFDALSRTYAYVFQRPLHYLFYILVASIFGALGWLLVSGFAEGVVALTDWAASWACGNERMEAILDHEASAGYLITFWQDGVRILAVGFLYSYFWTAATAIYFLLRRNVDATEMDEVYLDDEAGEVHGLPNIGADEQGAPVVEDSCQTETTPETNADNDPDDPDKSAKE